MPDVTRLLQQIENGSQRASDELLPIVYGELRQLAKSRLNRESDNHSLQSTALVHEAYLRLVGEKEPNWSGAGHFFGAAAEAMRRILIERARKRKTEKHGGQFQRVPLSGQPVAELPRDERLLQLDEALSELQRLDSRKADVVKLRFFAGLTNQETA
ncbi:MAG: RNA polymerase subunit sigma, partial [Planctomycetales bacterium]|nr:RNA polymerase subunit sigma [Planctomycetales bacterium]